MYLKRLDIRGFKSFADNTELVLKPEMNILVGPNGCGKSNVVDAIRWVLGEGNVRNLRGQKGEDVIFNGTDNKRALGMAYVEMTLDNSDHLLPLDYSEICIGRKIFRSGESEFYLNKSRVRMKDIADLMMGTGLGKRGYSIISQGELEQVLQGQALDRRLILEEAAGIIKYRQQRDEVKRRLLNTGNDLLRLGDILGDLRERRDELSNKAEKATRYMHLSEEQQSMEKAVLHFELARSLNNLQQKKDEFAGREEKLKNLRKDLIAREERLAEEEEGLNVKRNYLSKLRDEIHHGESVLNSMQGEVRLGEERIKNKREQISGGEVDSKKYGEMLDNLSRDLEIGLVDYRKEEEKYLERVKEFAELEREVKELQSFMHTYQQSFEEKKAQMFDKMKAESQLKNEIIESEELFKKNREKKERLAIHIQELADKIAKEKQNRSESERERRDKEEEIRKTESFLTDLDEERSGLLSRIDLIDKDYKNLDQESLKINNSLLAIKDMQKNMHGYSPGVKAILSNANSGKLHGILGLVGEVIDVPRGMEMAVEVAAGRGLENIIVESIEDARTAINFLKRKKQGRVTFLPLDILKIGKVPASLVEDICGREGVWGLASQLVGFEKKFARAIDYLLGRVLIVENMEKGIEVFKGVNYPFRIVSLEGELINLSGAISGGHKTGQNISPLQRRGEEKRLMEVRDKNKLSCEENRKRAEETYGELKELDKEITSIKDNLMANKFRHEMLLKHLEGLQVDIENSEREKEQYVKQIGMLDTTIIELENKILDLEKKQDSMQNENEAINQELENFRAEIDRSKRDYEVRRERLLSYSEQVDMKKRELENMKKNIAQFEQVKSSYLQSLKESQELQERLQKEIDAESSKIARTARLIEDKGIDLDKLRQEMELVKESEKVHRNNIDAIRQEIIPCRENISQMENNIRNLEINMTRIETELEGLQDKWRDKFSIEIPGPEAEIQAANTIREYKKKIEILRIDIEKIGAVDLDSINEYERIRERFDFINGQYEDLYAGKESLESLLQETEKIMAKDFAHFILLARESFNKTFREIFGGGEAYLRLETGGERLEAGVDIEVKMPGKKSQSLSLLSGGERALTCIAFIFALLRLRPAPFCLLDEIDASLDETNLNRFCNFLKSMAADMQFIVISHRQATIESGENIYGITMPEKGVSSVLTISLEEAESLAG